MRNTLAILAGLGLLTFAPIASAETSGRVVKQGSYETTGDRSDRHSRRHGHQQKFYGYRSHDGRDMRRGHRRHGHHHTR